MHKKIWILMNLKKRQCDFKARSTIEYIHTRETISTLLRYVNYP